MNRYTEILKSQARAIELFFILAAIAGVLAYLVLPSDVYPELSFPRIAVIANAGDTSPVRMVVAVTRVLEQAVSQVYNVRWIRSKTIRGASEVNVDFQQDTNMQQALQQLQARVTEVRNTLPPNTDLTIERVTPAIFPVITYNVSSDTLTQSDLYYYANFVIRPALTRVPGVARVIPQGGEIQQVSVQVDPAKLSALRISLSQITDALQKGNQVQVLGKLNSNAQLNLVVSSESIDAIAQLNNIVVGETTKDAGRPTPVPTGEPGSGNPETGTMLTGAPIFLRDVATVAWGIADKTQIISVDGKPGIAINIFRQPNSNVLTVAQGVAEAFAHIKTTLPPGITFKVSYDESRLVTDAMTNVRDAILTGIVLIVIVLFIFLQEWRSTLIATLTIPLCALAVFGVLKLIGQSLNLMSLGGLAVAIGLIIDDAVVVIENIDHQMSAGMQPFAAVAAALKELVAPVVSSTVTTVVVFLPLGLLSGVAGQFFSSFCITLTSAVILSLVLSLTLTPCLSTRWLRAKKSKPRDDQFDSQQYLYARMLRFAFRYPILPAVLAAALLALGIAMSIQLGTDFLPAVDEGSYMLDYLAPPGSSLTEADSVAKVLEQILSHTPEVVAYTRRTGAESGLFATETNKGDIQVVLKPSNQRHRTIWQIMDEQRAQAEKLLPNADVDFHQILQDELNDLSGVESPVAIKIYGRDLAVLRRIGASIDKALEKTPGLVDLLVTGQAGAPETDIKVDPAEAGRVGLTPQDVMTQVQDALLGGIATQIRQQDRLIDVRVRLNDAFRNNPDTLNQIPVLGTANGEGKTLPLSALATISSQPGDSEITRENQQRYISVQGNVEGRDLGSLIAAIKKKLAKISAPAEYFFELGGTYNSQREAFSQLISIMLLAIILVYFVLIIQFRSWVQPLVIFTAVPLSLFGVVAALWLTHTSLNVSSFMGIILLIGLVVKNGIILLDFTNRLMREGHSMDEALIRAGAIRLRPILMTTICTVLGLLPLALGFGAGAELQKPLAVAVIGGLSLSTLFTLVFMPVVFRAIISTPNSHL
ncbi:MAG TPA: efflux RND transporter permease subunit [Planktothrix sp.]|jgi:CzcA family heavy metal efflux pump